MLSNMEQSYFFALLVGLLAVAAIMACRYRYGKWLNPIAIITGWWCGWLVVALVDIIGIDSPSGYLVSLIAIGMISLLSGALSGREYRTFQLIDYSNDLLYKRIARYLLALLLIVAVVPVSILLIKGLNLQAQIGNWLQYRGAAIGGEWGHSLLFESPTTQIAYAYIVDPLIFCGILWFQSRGIKLSGIERLLAALVTLLVISESISTGGRTTLYFMAIGMLYGWIFRTQHRGYPLLILKGRWLSNILFFLSRCSLSTGWPGSVKNDWEQVKWVCWEL